jgi:hypothetical protein
MQSRNFFTFGDRFNFLTDSLMVYQEKLKSSMIPPVSTYLMTEDNKFLITEDSNFLITNP